MAALDLTGGLKARKFETLTPTTSTGFTSTNYDVTGVVGSTHFKTLHAVRVLITVETQPIRYRMDGTAPTASVGHSVAAGDQVVIDGYDNIKNFRCIDTAAGASTVRCTFFFEQ